MTSSMRTSWIKQQALGWWRSQMSACPSINVELCERSRAARYGFRAIYAAYVFKALEPVLSMCLAVAVLALASTYPALAQTPGGGIFGGSDQQVGNSVRELIKWGRNLLFLMGVIGVGWGIMNFMMEKSWAKQVIGAMGCFAFGGIVQLVYSFSQGNSVNLDTSFGN